jgi:hypothetical protein
MAPSNNNNIPSPENKKVSIRTMQSDKQRFSGVKRPFREHREPAEPELISFSKQPYVPESAEPRPIPAWAREKLEEEIYQEPTSKKNLILTIIILAIVIGCVFIGYFLAVNFLFK